MQNTNESRNQSKKGSAAPGAVRDTEHDDKTADLISERYGDCRFPDDDLAESAREEAAQ